MLNIHISDKIDEKAVHQQIAAYSKNRSLISYIDLMHGPLSIINMEI
jgi:hypothetical protein